MPAIAVARITGDPRPIDGPSRVLGRLRSTATSTWFLGLVVALTAWNVAFAAPASGLDPSWWAALYMATHDGMHFGTQVIWTYGPLGFLDLSWLFYSNLAVISFLYRSALLIALCTSLVWSLRRTFNAPVAVAATFVLVAALPDLEAPIVLAAVWCLAALSDDAPAYARRVVVFGGAAYGAAECLMKVSVGPTILLMCAVALVARGPRRRDLAAFALTGVGSFAVLWFASGQAVSDLPHYVSSVAQIVSGYSQAMGLNEVSGWWPPVMAAALLVLVFWAIASAPRGPARVAAGVVMALAGFLVWKEAVVRLQIDRVETLFATATALALAIPWSNRRRLPGAWTMIAIGTLAVVAAPAGSPRNLNPVTNLRAFADQVRNLVSSGRRRDLSDAGRLVMTGTYRLGPRTLRLLAGRTVDVDPWEQGAAWAYGLDWDPQPVFQDYSAYTSALDNDNARALGSAGAPERILRENVPRVSHEYATDAPDGRFPAWDPPAAAVSMLCHYVPLQTTGRWQVLGRVGNRCGRPRLLRSIQTEYGSSVNVPSVPRGRALFAAVEGDQVSGLERLQSTLLRASPRYAIVNRSRSYRLVPGTANDGLLMSVPPSADFPGPGFSLSPDARDLKITGSSGHLTVRFYSMPIDPSGRVAGPRASSR